MNSFTRVAAALVATTAMAITTTTTRKMGPLDACVSSLLVRAVVLCVRLKPWLLGWDAAPNGALAQVAHSLTPIHFRSTFAHARNAAHYQQHLLAS